MAAGQNSISLAAARSHFSTGCHLVACAHCSLQLEFLLSCPGLVNRLLQQLKLYNLQRRRDTLWMFHHSRWLLVAQQFQTIASYHLMQSYCNVFKMTEECNTKALKLVLSCSHYFAVAISFSQRASGEGVPACWQPLIEWTVQSPLSSVAIPLESFHYGTPYWILFPGCLSLEATISQGMYTQTHTNTHTYKAS